MASKRRRRRRAVDDPGAGFAVGYWLFGLGVVLLIAAGSLLLIWANSIRGLTEPVSITVNPAWTRFETSLYLKGQGLIDDPRFFVAYWTVRQPRLQVEPGIHIVAPYQAPADLLLLLARRSNRPRLNVSIPEGWTTFQIAARLADLAICDADETLRLAHSKDFARKLGLGADSVEGYLFPDTYELFLDSSPELVLTKLVEQAKLRHAALFNEHEERLNELQLKFGFGPHQIVTLGSMIEKEAGEMGQHAKIASVFFNRLTDPTFKPAKMLQSDPTAGYGCLQNRALPSCQGFTGRITPELLRDQQNPYNTYRNPGLPPGPICNPGVEALRSVLQPEQTGFFFFVADGRGGHVFSRTLTEHDAAMAGGR